MSATIETPAVAAPRTQPPSAMPRCLVCRECGTEQPLGPFYACPECFGPLEVGYDFPGRHPGSHRGRSQEHLALRRAAARARRHRRPSPTPSRASPSSSGRQPRPRAGHASGCGSRTTPATRPTRSRTASSPSRWPPLASSDCRSSPARRPATSPTPSPRPPRVRASRVVVLIPRDLERPKILTTAVYGGTLIAVEGNYDDVNRLASEIAGEEEDWAFVNVNVRPYYAEGSKTLGLRGRRAARLAAARAGRDPDRVGLAADQGRQGLPRARRARPRRGHAVQDLRRAGHGLLAGRDGVPGRPRRRPPGQARHDRQVAGDRQPGRRAVRARRRAGAPAGRSRT